MSRCWSAFGKLIVEAGWRSALARDARAIASGAKGRWQSPSCWRPVSIPRMLNELVKRRLTSRCCVRCDWRAVIRSRSHFSRALERRSESRGRYRPRNWCRQRHQPVRFWRRRHRKNRRGLRFVRRVGTPRWRVSVSWLLAWCFWNRYSRRGPEFGLLNGATSSLSPPLWTVALAFA